MTDLTTAFQKAETLPEDEQQALINMISKSQYWDEAYGPCLEVFHSFEEELERLGISKEEFEAESKELEEELGLS